MLWDFMNHAEQLGFSSCMKAGGGSLQSFKADLFFERNNPNSIEKKEVCDRDTKT